MESGRFTLSGSGGPPSTAFTLLTSTDLALSESEWAPVSMTTATRFDADGNFNLSVPVDSIDTKNPDAPERYFVLQFLQLP